VDVAVDFVKVSANGKAQLRSREPPASPKVGR